MAAASAGHSAATRRDPVTRPETQIILSSLLSSCSLCIPDLYLEAWVAAVPPDQRKTATDTLGESSGKAEESDTGPRWEVCPIVLS